MENAHLWIGYAQDCNAFYICLGLAIILVLVDYLFPVDWPAYFGYLMFGAASFFAVTDNITHSLLWGLGVFVGLLIAHKLLFSRFLTNAPHLEKGDYK